MDDEIIYYSEDGGMHISNENGFSLHDLCKYGNLNEVKKYLEKNHDIIDINECDQYAETALYISITRERKEIVELLLEYGADTEKRDIHGNTPLMNAVLHESKKIVYLLLSKGADVNAIDNNNGSTALLEAVCAGNTKIVKILISYGAAINIADFFGITPMTAIFMIDQENDDDIYNEYYDEYERADRETDKNEFKKIYRLLIKYFWNI